MNTEPVRSKSLNVLAYVHLRNIYASTGAGRVARQLTESLSKRSDVNLHVLADAADKERILPLVGEPWTSLRYHTFATDTSRQQARWFALNNPKAESYWPEAEIVFCAAESYVPVRKACLAVTLHDAAYFETSAHAKGMPFLKQQLKWKFLFRRLSNKADLFHTVSDFSAQRLAHFFPEIASRLCVVPNAVTAHFFAPVLQAGITFLEEQALDQRPFLLIPGGLHFRKNADLIIATLPDLLDRFPGVDMVIVNHSNPYYVTQASALGPRVRLLGFVSEEALHALYANARVVWFPSLYEGFGLPVVEAMACGTPVVASNASSIPEVAGEAALLVDAFSGKQHLEALEAVLVDDHLRAELGEKGRLRASQFTWAESAAKLKSAFDKLVSSK